MKNNIILQVKPKTFLFADDGSIPNNPHLPLILYPAALNLAKNDSATLCELIFQTNGWGGIWRNGIYTYHHFHSTAHEVLAIARGQAKVQFGGEQGVIMNVQSGDVVVIPAGVGHKNLGSSTNLLVVGAYPAGQRWDLCRGKPEQRLQILNNITQVPLPETDPIYGAEGLLVSHWV